jgi:TetR/AcrR family transcriptional regulator
VIPLVRKDIEVFEQWIAAGKVAPINATHLLFAIWAMTQSYADFSAQMALVLNRKQLTEGFRRWRTSHRRHGAGGDQRAAGR